MGINMHYVGNQSSIKGLIAKVILSIWHMNMRNAITNNNL